MSNGRPTGNFARCRSWALGVVFLDDNSLGRAPGEDPTDALHATVFVKSGCALRNRRGYLGDGPQIAPRHPATGARVMDLSTHCMEELGSDGTLVLCCAATASSEQPVLVVVRASDPPAKWTDARLENAL